MRWRALPEGWLRSLLVDGVIAGAGGVLVFLPQIVILFFFILVLEESGYLPRAAFLLDRLMGGVGLSGRSFIPLLSSFACAIPASWRRAPSPTRATGW
jgi:ferrous iron transport protein B